MEFLVFLVIFTCASQALRPLDDQIKDAAKYLEMLHRNIFPQGNQGPLVSQPPKKRYHSNPSLASMSRTTARTCMDSRILSGVPSYKGQFPWQVNIFMDKKGMCSGTIISDKWILTTAYCIKGRRNMRISMGTNNRLKLEPDSLVIDTNNVVIHPLYDRVKIKHDIGLIKLCAPIQFSSYITPLRLPSRYTEKMSFVGTTLRVSGWGHTSDSNDTTDIQNFADVSVISNKECNKVYKYVQNQHLCTVADPTGNVCKGEGGDGLLWVDYDCMYTLVGIAAFTHRLGCPLAPSGFVRVSSYLDWINQETGIEMTK